MTTELTPTRTKRGPYAKSKRTQRAILDAALEVFAQGGFRAGSLREIAERVGISEAGILHHYPSKIALLEAVLTHRDDISRSVFMADENDGKVVLRSLVQIARHNSSIPGVVELFAILAAESTSPEHPAHEYFQDRYRFVMQIVEHALRQIAEEGGLRPGVEPAQATRSIIALMDGLQIQWLLNRDSVDMSADVRAHLNLLLREPIVATDEGTPPTVD